LVVADFVAAAVALIADETEVVAVVSNYGDDDDDTAAAAAAADVDENTKMKTKDKGASSCYSA